MKKRAIFLTSVFCILLLAGCTAKPQEPPADTEPPTSSTQPENPGPASLRNSIRESNCMLGVGFFGYIDSESDADTVQLYVADSALAKAYPLLNDLTPVLLEGTELYALVPAGSNTSVTIYRAELSEEGSYIDHKDAPLYAGEPGEAVILRCNLSEIHANVLISVTDGTDTLEFHPMISLENGRPVQEPGCLDFSVYDDGEDNSAETALALLLETDEVQDALGRGMELLYTGDTQNIEGRPCLLFALGTNHEDQFVRERYYAVSDSLIYVYLPEEDSWEILGVG